VARRPTVSIVGCGRAGGSIGLALARNGYEVTAVWSRSRAGRQRAQRLLDVPVLAEIAEVAGAADVVLVSVPDDAIHDVADQVGRGIRTGKVAVHTSGGVSIEALAPVRAAGARPASVHPLQTLPDPTRGAEALRGAAVAVTSEPTDRALLFRLARSWGGRPFALADNGKSLYHAAAVMASNYLVTSVWAATRLLEKLAVPGARHLIAPLAQASIDNATTMPAAKAITGPVARGDIGTVQRHIEALCKDDPTDGRIADAYGALARLTAALAGGDVDAFDKATK
jgi:predicted short-subunit dehydrogenase-like oxidoreductase (DUF2520 family)